MNLYILGGLQKVGKGKKKMKVKYMNIILARFITTTSQVQEEVNDPLE